MEEKYTELWEEVKKDVLKELARAVDDEQLDASLLEQLASAWDRQHAKLDDDRQDADDGTSDDDAQLPAQYTADFRPVEHIQGSSTSLPRLETGRSTVPLEMPADRVRGAGSYRFGQP
jgi:hypothetical protein